MDKLTIAHKQYKEDTKQQMLIQVMVLLMEEIAGDGANGLFVGGGGIGGGNAASGADSGGGGICDTKWISDNSICPTRW